MVHIGSGSDAGRRRLAKNYGLHGNSGEFEDRRDVFQFSTREHCGSILNCLPVPLWVTCWGMQFGLRITSQLNYLLDLIPDSWYSADVSKGEKREGTSLSAQHLQVPSSLDLDPVIPPLPSSVSVLSATSVVRIFPSRRLPSPKTLSARRVVATASLLTTR